MTRMPRKPQKPHVTHCGGGERRSGVPGTVSKTRENRQRLGTCCQRQVGADQLLSPSCLGATKRLNDGAVNSNPSVFNRGLARVREPPTKTHRSELSKGGCSFRLLTTLAGLGPVPQLGFPALSLENNGRRRSTTHLLLGCRHCTACFLIACLPTTAT
ncbi:hypothetical protein VTK26DRAFT_739 [Humicola hyalothermophila]